MKRTIDLAFFQEAAVCTGFGAVAVIDTLRATTTITAILDRGGVGVRPVLNLEDAYALKSRDAELLLGGERNNHQPPGFDGGNSPSDWPKSRVAGRRVVFTTTNGTTAVERVRSIPRLILGALTNAEAAGRYLWALERPALLVASGARGQAALEDVLAAGAIASVWPRSHRSDAAEIACALFERERTHLVQALAESAHGRDLMALGLSRDLEFAGTLNQTLVVPILCADGWLRTAD